jgi:hypothetical protein
MQHLTHARRAGQDATDVSSASESGTGWIFSSAHEVFPVTDDVCTGWGEMAVNIA